jgi:hypothetical protein
MAPGSWKSSGYAGIFAENRQVGKSLTGNAALAAFSAANAAGGGAERTGHVLRNRGRF